MGSRNAIPGICQEMAQWDSVSLELHVTECNLEDVAVCRGEMRDNGSCGRQDSWMSRVEHHVCVYISILMQQLILENVVYNGEGNRKVFLQFPL